jgi:hypothetical protein
MNFPNYHFDLIPELTYQSGNDKNSDFVYFSKVFYSNSLTKNIIKISPPFARLETDLASRLYKIRPHLLFNLSCRLQKIG